MTVSEARAAAASVLAELPQQVHDALEHVSLRVLDRPPRGCPSDTKGLFVGHAQICDPDEAEEEDDSEAGEHYDIGPSGDVELVAVGGGAPARGTIYLVAPNLDSRAALEETALHEISHALGYTEDGAEELGL